MWVCVRCVGSIGIFYPMLFDDVSTKEEWFEKYSDKWEFHHFIIPIIRGDHLNGG